MSIINNVNEKLHRIRVKLYPNYLPNAEGRYIARTNNEASLTIDEVCAYLNNRGGFADNYENLIQHVHQYFDEAAYLLCDGFGINTGYFSIHPNVGGTFDSTTEGHDSKKHKVAFRFRALAPLRRLADLVAIEIQGLADTSGWIDEFVDVEDDSVNDTFIPGNTFSISGHKIKIVGDDDLCGVYFVPEEDPSKAVKVKRLAENSSTKIIGKAPDTEHLHNRLEIRTQFNGSSNSFLKKPRVIKSSFTIAAA